MKKDDFISADAINPEYLGYLRNLTDVFWFGKFKGCTVQHALNTEPHYLVWLIEETDKAAFSSEIENLIYQKADDAKEDDPGLFGRYY